MQYNELRKQIEDNRFNFKKKFGQNFIIDENIINSIVDKASIDSDTLVIEIGPGAGSLTNKLCSKAKNVLAYEIDESLKPILSSLSCSNLEIIYGDFLKSNVAKDIRKYNYSKLYVVANLPYYITTPILMKFINERIDVSKIVIMVQKEVGDRFSAKVGTKDYSSLSIFLNYYFDVKKILDVSRNVFIPKPNVDSIVVEFCKKKSKLNVLNEEVFFKLVRDSFKQKRKTIKNNLNGYDLTKIEKILLENNLNLSSRAEQIDIDVFAQIANKITKENI